MRGSWGWWAGVGISILSCAGCGDATAGSDAAFQTDGKVLARSLAYPGNLVVAGGDLVFSTAGFVGSGDPELDQQFAYWEGEIWKVARTGGGKKSLAKPNGAVQSVAKLGDDLLVLDSGYMGVSRISPADGAESDFYNDYTHFPDEGDDLPTLGGLAVGKSAVYVTRPGSEVVRIAPDGSDVTVFAKTWRSGWVEGAQEIVALDGALFWSTEQQGEQGSSYRLYRAALGGDTTPQRLATFPNAVRALATDGEQVFVAIAAGHGEPGAIDVAPADGSRAPRSLLAGSADPDDLLYDGRFGLFFLDYETGELALVPAAALADPGQAEPVTVVAGPHATAFALDADYLYLATFDGEAEAAGSGAIRRYALADLDAL